MDAHAFDIRFYIPFFSILFPMVFAIIAPLIKKRSICRNITLVMFAFVAVMSLMLIPYLSHVKDNYFVFMAGHFPAPWGNELRAGYAEAIVAFALSAVCFISVWGGKYSTDNIMAEKRGYLYYILLNFVLASVLALVYTNDVFTAYVFIEINTCAAVAIMYINEGKKALASSMKYLVMSMVGSGLFLFGLCYLYAITGQLLMTPLKEEISLLIYAGEYSVPLLVAFAMVGIGLCLKSGLFPLHAWFPDAYTYAPHTSSALLSGVVSKAYIFLFIKFIYRVFGTGLFSSTHFSTLILILSFLAIIIGSVFAFMQKDLKKMIAFSSVAQIGYIFMGIGLNSQLGYAAAIFHIVFHAFTKSMLFISAGNMIEKSGKTTIEGMRGMAYKTPVSAIAFWVGGLSMIGIPLFAGFITKLNFATAGYVAGNYWVLIVLAVSTCLNVLYFIPVMTILYSKKEHTVEVKKERESLGVALPLVAFMCMNVVFGVFQGPVMDLITQGLNTLG